MERGQIRIERKRWIIRRKSDGAIVCGLARDYQFKTPDKIGATAIKTWRSEKQALAAFDRSWGEGDVEAVEVVEALWTPDAVPKEGPLDEAAKSEAKHGQ